jgi:mxaJ protein
MRLRAATGRGRAALLVLLLATAVHAQPAPRQELRVCADPNNLPFSNQRLEGFENRIVALIGRDLGLPVTWVWWAQRRGFVRDTLAADLCDVIPGVPSSFERTLVTRPYYRSSYVFVSRADRRLELRSFDDPALRQLRVGVQMIGDDYANSPPAHALAQRHIVENVVGFSVYGDYSHENPPADIVTAVENGGIDLAVVWGPLAGFFAGRSPVPLTIVPVSPQIDVPFLPFVFDISMGVRRGEDSFRQQLDRVLERRKPEIDVILREYGVPLLQTGRGGQPG